MTSFTSGSRKKQVRFQTKDDLVLLREVLAKNPFQNKSAWNEIASAVADTRSNLQVDARRVRERTHLLIDQHKKSNADSLKSSGIDEEYGEKETLLDEILSLVEDEEKQKEKQKEKKETEENRGKEIRKRAMENLTPKKGDDDSNDATPSKRNSSGNIVGYLKEKNDADLIYRRQELEVKKQQLQLEEEKFKLEKHERMQKLENDKQEKTLMFELLKKCLGDRH
ncbi:MAP7 domain-containing protein 2-like [Mytilus edulis]|uniref:MAP7 domain-containing protein 2-like n=1 Tax=Mytilus edulis TaxID=6550 RepID=UPI0039EFF2CD